MTINLKASLLAGLTLGATGAVAADATFDNHLTSTAMVSPAQLYQVEEMKTDFALGYVSAESSTKAGAGAKIEAEGKGTGLFAAGVYNIKGLGLRAGLAVDYMSLDRESTTSATGMASTTTEDEAGMVTFSPQLAYTAGPVVVGAAVDVHQNSEKPQTGDTQKATYTQFRPGVLFAMDQVEAGVAYETRRKTTVDPTKTDELAVAVPATTTIHGRYAVSREMAFGGIVKQINWQGLDKDMNKAQTKVTGTAEMKMGAVKVEGDVGVNTAYYKKKDFMSSGNIGTTELGAAADYMLGSKASVGGALAYEFGSDKNAGQEFETNTLGVLVRGDMKF